MKKICSKCKIEKDLEEFYKDSRSKDGKQSMCKTCIKKYYKDNKPERLKYHREYREQSHIKEKQSKYTKEWREKNKEKLANYKKEWAAKNKDKLAEKRRTYYEKNKEHLKLYQKIYYSTEKGKLLQKTIGYKKRLNKKLTINSLSVPEQNIILFLQNYKCISCNKYFDELEPTLDHIIPLSAGGNLTKQNTQILCRACNSKKHTRTTDFRDQTHINLITTI